MERTCAHMNVEETWYMPKVEQTDVTQINRLGVQQVLRNHRESLKLI